MIKDMSLMSLTELKYWCIENYRNWSTNGVSAYQFKAKEYYAEYERRGGKEDWETLRKRAFKK